MGVWAEAVRCPGGCDSALIFGGLLEKQVCWLPVSPGFEDIGQVTASGPQLLACKMKAQHLPSRSVLKLQ